MRKFYLILLSLCAVCCFGQNQITGYTFWYNNDYASRTTQAIVPQQQAELSFQAETSGLTEGLNIFHFQVFDQNNVYSSPVSKFFYKTKGALSDTNRIAAYRYWFNTDLADVDTVYITPVKQADIIAEIDASNLNDGLNSIHFQVMDQQEIWSSVLSQYFLKSNTHYINAYQYWFNSDIASVVTVSVFPSKIVLINDAIDASALNEGMNIMHLRFRDEQNLWSSTISQFFFKTEAGGVDTAKICGYQYWFDNNFADAVTQNITPTTEAQISTAIETSLLPHGLHVFNIRFKQENGLWSSPLSSYFFKMPESNSAQNMITEYQYWFNNNFTQAVHYVLPQAMAQHELLLSIDMTQMPKGNYQFNLRTKDTLGLWSSVITDTFTKNPFPISSFNADITEFCDSGFVQFTNNSIDGDVYLWDFGDGTTSNAFAPQHFFAAPGQYIVSLTVTDIATQLDSTTSLTITVHPWYHFKDTVNICIGESYFWRGQTHNQTGIYYDSLSTIYGCDSVYVLHLIVHPLPIVEISGLLSEYCFINQIVTMQGTLVGGSFSGAGVTGSSFNPGQAGSGTWPIVYCYADVNSCVNCDTVFVTVFEEVNPGTIGVDQTICYGQTPQTIYGTPASGGDGNNPYWWEMSVDGGLTWITCPAPFQTINYTPSPMSACYRRMIYSSCGIVSSNITCITVNPIFEFAQNELICFGDTFHWRGNDYYSSGNYYDSLYTQQGCDSVYVLHLIVHPLPIVEITGLLSEYCFINQIITMQGTPVGGSFSGSGVTGSSFNPGQAGSGTWPIVYCYADTNSCVACDTFFVTVFDALTGGNIASSQTICYNTSPDAFTNVQLPTGGTGQYTYQWQQQVGCVGVWTDIIGATESTFDYTGNIIQTTCFRRKVVSGTCGTSYSNVVSVSLFPVYTMIQNEQICQGGVFNWRGHNYVTSGIYYDSLTTVYNCDSVFMLHLTVNPVYEFTHTASICFGDVYNWRGNAFSMAGIYYDSLQTVNGCDSVYSLNLSVFPSYYYLETDTFCEGNTYFWRGNYYTSAGTYFDYHNTQHNCDSVYSLELFMRNRPTVSINSIDSLYCVYHAPVSLTAIPQGGVFVGQGVSGSVFSPAAAGIGNWAVVYTFTDSLGCFNADTVFVTVDACTNIADNNSKVFKLYPNPNSGRFYMELAIHADLVLFNTQGAQVYSASLNPGIHNIKLNLESGLYYIQLRTDRGFEVFRFVVCD